MAAISKWAIQQLVADHVVDSTFEAVRTPLSSRALIIRRTHLVINGHRVTRIDHAQAF